MALLRRAPSGDTNLTAAPLAELLDNRDPVKAPPPLSAREQRRAPLLEDPERAMRIAPRKGWPQPFSGRAANTARVEVYRADTERASGIYPFLHAASLPPVG